MVANIQQQADAAAIVPVPDCLDWPDRPVYLRPEPSSGMRVVGPKDGKGGIQVGQEHEFESEIFKGRFILRASGLPTSDPDQFGAKQRKLQFVVQGTFKEGVRYKEVITGQEFSRPFNTVPASGLVRLVLSVVQRISPCYTLAGPHEARPGLTGPLLGLAQSVCVSEPGQEPAIAGQPFEDTSMLGDQFPASFAERKKVFSKPGAWEDECFDTSKVWTFGFWQHLLSISDFNVDLGVTRLSAGKYIRDQPLILTSRAGSQALYSIEIWNEQLAKGAAERQQPNGSGA